MTIRLALLVAAIALPASARAGNPIVRDVFTADPAAIVHGGRVYLYAGRDEAPAGGKDFVMKEWRCFSSDDMVHWKDEGSPMSLKTFPWADSDAWAGQVIERDGRFYWYAAVHEPGGHGIAVGVSDRPTGPFKDAIGHALVKNGMTHAIDPDTGKEKDWDDIDPTVWIDGDGQAYLLWGNGQLYLARLKRNMIELEGGIERIELPGYFEAPYLHAYRGKYYLSYAYGYPSKIAYATADKVTGPYVFQGIINDFVPHSKTNHQAILEFKDRWYFLYHTAALSGDMHRRSVCVDELHYDEAGHIVPIVQTR